MRLFSLIITCVILSGCVTRAVWKENDPNGFVEVREEIFEKEMRGKIDVPYYKLSDGVVYVKRSGLSKFKAYAVRTFSTPFTVTVDIISFGVIGSLYVTGATAANPRAIVEMGNAMVK